MDLWAARAGPRQPVDSTRGPTLVSLLREIQEIEGEFWVRLLYTHPAHWSDELIETIAACGRVARCISTFRYSTLTNRCWAGCGVKHAARVEGLICKLRAGIPGVTLRTTFIVGFPGETDAEFETLLDFIGRSRFERLGIFEY